MGASDIGDQAAGRFYIPDELLNITGMRRTHLNDGYVVFGTYAEQCTGHAHIIVVIGLGSVYVEFL